MELAIQIISNDQTIRSDTLQYLKVFNFHSLATKAKKVEQLVSTTPAIKNAFHLLGNDVVELSTETESLTKIIGSYDE